MADKNRTTKNQPFSYDIQPIKSAEKFSSSNFAEKIGCRQLYTSYCWVTDNAANNEPTYLVPYTVELWEN